VKFYNDLADSNQGSSVFASIDGIGQLDEVKSRIVTILG